MCEQTGRCNHPPSPSTHRHAHTAPPTLRRNAFSQRDGLLHRAERAEGEGQPFHFSSRQTPKNSGRDRANAVREKLSTQAGFGGRVWGGLFTDFQERFDISESKTAVSVTQNDKMHAKKQKKKNLSHLLVEAQLIIQDDAVGLLRLRPRQREAVHGGADLVHDGNDGGSCRAQGEQHSEFVWQWRDCFMFVCGCVRVWNSESEKCFFFQFGEVLTNPGKQLKGETLNGDKVVTTVGGKLKSPLPLVLQQLIPCNTFSKLCPTPAVGIKGVQHLWEPLQSDLSSLTSSPQSLARLLNKAFQIWAPVARWLRTAMYDVAFGHNIVVDLANIRGCGLCWSVSWHSFSVSSSVSRPADHLESNWLLDWVVWTERQTRSSQHSFTSRGYTGICCPQWIDYVLHFSLTYKQMKTYRALCEETSSFADKVALQCAALQNIEF